VRVIRWSTCRYFWLHRGVLYSKSSISLFRSDKFDWIWKSFQWTLGGTCKTEGNSFRIPSLKERLDDLEPNLDYELKLFANKARHLVSFNKTAREKYLNLASSNEALWSADFRDLNASITRMALWPTAVELQLKILVRKWIDYAANGEIFRKRNIILESSVGRVEVCDCGDVDQGVTTRNSPLF